MESDDDEESEDDIAAGTREENESKISVTPDETIKKKAKTPKPKKSKDVTKKPVKRERIKTNHKISNDFKKHMNRAEIMEDPDLDKEIDILAMNGLKNQVQTLQFSRLMGIFIISFYSLICNKKILNFLQIFVNSSCQITKGKIAFVKNAARGGIAMSSTFSRLSWFEINALVDVRLKQLRSTTEPQIPFGYNPNA